MSTGQNQFGGRFTNMKSQLQSDIYDAANSTSGENVLIKYSKLEAIVQQEIAKAYRRGYVAGYGKGSKYYLKNLPARKVRNMCEVCGRLSAELTIEEHKETEL